MNADGCSPTRPTGHTVHTFGVAPVIHQLVSRRMAEVVAAGFGAEGGRGSWCKGGGALADTSSAVTVDFGSGAGEAEVAAGASSPPSPPAGSVAA